GDHRAAPPRGGRRRRPAGRGPTRGHPAGGGGAAPRARRVARGGRPLAHDPDRPCLTAAAMRPFRDGAPVPRRRAHSADGAHRDGARRAPNGRIVGAVSGPAGVRAVLRCDTTTRAGAVEWNRLNSAVLDSVTL